jgi:hypothetical protein
MSCDSCTKLAERVSELEGVKDDFYKRNVELLKEIERLNVWSSDSHIQDVEAENVRLRQLLEKCLYTGSMTVVQLDELEAEIKETLQSRQEVILGSDPVKGEGATGSARPDTARSPAQEVTEHVCTHPICGKDDPVNGKLICAGCQAFIRDMNRKQAEPESTE